MQIRIIQTPSGEAPEHIRTAWIGLTLTVAADVPLRVETVGVIRKPATRFGLALARFFGRTKKENGYIVEASTAIDILAAHAPEAAQWRRENAPRAIARGEYFLFATEACQEVAV